MCSMFSRPPMSAKFLRAAIGLGCAAALSLSLHASAQTPSPAQIQAFKSLPQDQQQALMQQHLGSAGGAGGLPPGVTNGGGTPTIQPNATLPNGLQPNASTLQGLAPFKSDKTRDGHYLRQANENPELRANDTVLIQLRPTPQADCVGGAAGSGNGATPANVNSSAGAGAGAGAGANSSSAPGVDCSPSAGEQGAGGTNAYDFGG